MVEQEIVASLDEVAGAVGAVVVGDVERVGVVDVVDGSTRIIAGGSSLAVEDASGDVYVEIEDYAEGVRDEPMEDWLPVEVEVTSLLYIAHYTFAFACYGTGSMFCCSRQFAELDP